MQFIGVLSLPQRGRGTALAVDEEVALLWALRPCKDIVPMHKNLCAKRQNPHRSREIHPNGDLLIHHLRWSPFSAGEGYSQQFDKSKFENRIFVISPITGDKNFAVYVKCNVFDKNGVRHLTRWGVYGIIT